MRTHTIFPAAALEDLLLIGVLADKAVDGDLLALPYPVTASHGLQVILHSHNSVPCWELCCSRKLINHII